jgi:hypothetical protein
MALVATDGADVVGFALGRLDTALWENRLERDGWQSLRAGCRDPGDLPAEETITICIGRDLAA